MTAVEIMADALANGLAEKERIDALLRQGIRLPPADFGIYWSAPDGTWTSDGCNAVKDDEDL